MNTITAIFHQVFKSDWFSPGFDLRLRITLTEIFQKYFLSLYDSSSAMDRYYCPAIDLASESASSLETPTATEKISMYENLESNRCEPEMEPEENENEQSQDNNSQTSTPSCVSKMDYTLPKYHNNVSPAIDKLMRIMHMPSLILSGDSSDYLPPPPSCVSSPNYHFGENPAVPILTREYLNIWSPKPFINTYKRDSEEDGEQPITKDIDPSLFQIAQEPLSSGWQRAADSLPNREPVVSSPCSEDTVYVSEACFLLMASNRNRRRKANLRGRSRTISKDSAFSEFMSSDEE